MAFVYVPYEGPVVTRADAKAAGVTRYFTRNLCKYNHLSQRQVANFGCIACLRIKGELPEQKAREADYRRANAESARKRASAHYYANRDAINAAKSIPADQKKAFIKEQIRQKLRDQGLKECRVCKKVLFLADFTNCSANWDGLQSKCRVCEAAHRRQNRSSITKSNVKWARQNPLATLAILNTRRAKKKNTGGRHTAEDILELLRVQKGKCAHPWCRIDIRNGYHIDHRVPLSRGGSNDKKNLQLLCQPCNQSKGARYPTDHARINGFLV